MTYVARHYDHKNDRELVNDVCEGVYNNSDFVPRKLLSLCSDVSCCPVVISDSAPPQASTVVAFANVRAVESDTDSSLRLIEAVRVHRAFRGMGFGKRIVADSIRLATSKFRESQNDNAVRRLCYASVTWRDNVPMFRAFQSLGFECYGDFVLWPSMEIFEATKLTAKSEACKSKLATYSMLQALKVDHIVSDHSIQLLGEWEPIQDKKRFAEAIHIGWRPRSEPSREVVLLPRFYSVTSIHAAWRMISQNNASAWTAPEQDSAILVFDRGSENYLLPTALILAPTAALAEAAVVFIDRRLKLGNFYAVFSRNLSASLLSESPVFVQSTSSFVVVHNIVEAL